MDILNYFQGALLGLAVGDALGTTLEFTSPQQFEPISDLVGGGPFGLAPGQWTDDTSMALCLAESLLEKKRFDAGDQLDRYVRWWKDGHLSSTGKCFDIGNTTRQALERFLQTRDPYCGSVDAQSAGNGSIVRLAPVAMYFANHPPKAIVSCGNSSRTTHCAPATIDACRFFGALIVGALHQQPKEQLLSPQFAPIGGYWRQHPLVPEIEAITNGSYKQKSASQMRASGYVVHTLSAALWAFYHSQTFEEGALLAVNLGEDADSTGAVYGQLAGAFYGVQAIPSRWLEKLAMRDLITDYANRLCQVGGN
ncbi:MAG TPA: ADP-ribosylglycohydrolase family protein [Anaerolineales bacterium]|nr:ADP-ribosylglycohydrolase family protein [Anaerolineales bacterium]